MLKRHLLRVPTPLTLLLIVVALLGCGWALFTPPWEAPDEPAHFAYVESIAQRHALPGTEPGQVYSSAQSQSLQATNGDKLSQLSDGRPQWAPEGSRLQRSTRTDNGGGAEAGDSNPARTNPPGYYVLELPPYAVAAALGGNTEARLYLMRLWSVGFLLITVVGTWLLVGELLGRRRILQLVGAGVVGMLPMLDFVSSSVTPDSLLFASWAVALWLSARILNRGVTLAPAVALGAVVAVSVLTKATSYALVPAALAALFGGALRDQRKSLPVAAAGGAVMLAPIAAWVLATRLADRPAVNQVGGGGTSEALTDQGINLGQIASYLWQFYLPRLDSMTDFPTVSGVPVYDVWLKDAAGRFGWVQISQPGWVYVVLGVMALAVLVAGAFVLLGPRGAGRRKAALLLGAASLLLIAGLHYTDYQVGVQQNSPFMQGRYLLPLIAVFGVLVAGALSLVPRRWQPSSAALILGCMLALQAVSISRAAGFWFV